MLAPRAARSSYTPSSGTGVAGTGDGAGAGNNDDVFSDKVSSAELLDMTLSQLLEPNFVLKQTRAENVDGLTLNYLVFQPPTSAAAAVGSGGTSGGSSSTGVDSDDTIQSASSSSSSSSSSDSDTQVSLRSQLVATVINESRVEHLTAGFLSKPNTAYGDSTSDSTSSSNSDSASQDNTSADHSTDQVLDRLCRELAAQSYSADEFQHIAHRRAHLIAELNQVYAADHRKSRGTVPRRRVFGPSNKLVETGVQSGVYVVLSMLQATSIANPDQCEQLLDFLHATLARVPGYGFVSDGDETQPISKVSTDAFEAVHEQLFSIAANINVRDGIRKRCIELLLGLGLACGSATFFLSCVRLLLFPQSSSSSSLPVQHIRALDTIIKLESFRRTVYLPPMSARNHESQMNISDIVTCQRMSVACDGPYLYVHCDTGLFKIGTGRNGSIPSQIYATMSYYRSSEYSALSCAHGKLYYRSADIAPAALVVLDCNTLTEIGEIYADGSGTVTSTDNTHFAFGVPMPPKSKRALRAARRRPKPAEIEQVLDPATAAQSGDAMAQKKKLMEGKTAGGPGAGAGAGADGASSSASELEKLKGAKEKQADGSASGTSNNSGSGSTSATDANADITTDDISMGSLPNTDGKHSDAIMEAPSMDMDSADPNSMDSGVSSSPTGDATTPEAAAAAAADTAATTSSESSTANKKKTSKKMRRFSPVMSDGRMLYTVTPVQTSAREQKQLRSDHVYAEVHALDTANDMRDVHSVVLRQPEARQNCSLRFRHEQKGAGVASGQGFTKLNCGNPQELNFEGSATLECWVRLSGQSLDNGNYQGLFNHGDQSCRTYMYTNRNYFCVGSNHSSGSSSLGCNVRLVRDEWVHLAATCDSVTRTWTAYVNGSQVGISSNQQAAIHAQQGDWIIGTSTNYSFAGDMADVRIWNRALTASEIKRNMKHPINADTADGLVLYLPCDDGFGLTARDLSPTGAHGMIVGPSSWIEEVRPCEVSRPNKTVGAVLDRDQKHGDSAAGTPLQVHEDTLHEAVFFTNSHHIGVLYPPRSHAFPAIVNPVLQVFAVESGQLVEESEHTYVVSALGGSFSPDGSHLYLAQNDTGRSVLHRYRYSACDVPKWKELAMAQSSVATVDMSKRPTATELSGAFPLQPLRDSVLVTADVIDGNAAASQIPCPDSTTAADIINFIGDSKLGDNEVPVEAVIVGILSKMERDCTFASNVDTVNIPAALRNRLAVELNASTFENLIQLLEQLSNDLEGCNAFSSDSTSNIDADYAKIVSAMVELRENSGKSNDNDSNDDKQQQQQQHTDAKEDSELSAAVLASSTPPLLLGAHRQAGVRRLKMYALQVLVSVLRANIDHLAGWKVDMSVCGFDPISEEEVLNNANSLTENVSNTSVSSGSASVSSPSSSSDTSARAAVLKLLHTNGRSSTGSDSGDQKSTESSNNLRTRCVNLLQRFITMKPQSDFGRTVMEHVSRQCCEILSAGMEVFYGPPRGRIAVLWDQLLRVTDDSKISVVDPIQAFLAHQFFEVQSAAANICEVVPTLTDMNTSDELLPHPAGAGGIPAHLLHRITLAIMRVVKDQISDAAPISSQCDNGLMQSSLMDALAHDEAQQSSTDTDTTTDTDADTDIDVDVILSRSLNQFLGRAHVVLFEQARAMLQELSKFSVEKRETSEIAQSQERQVQFILNYCIQVLDWCFAAFTYGIERIDAHAASQSRASPDTAIVSKVELVLQNHVGSIMRPLLSGLWNLILPSHYAGLLLPVLHRLQTAVDRFMSKLPTAGVVRESKSKKLIKQLRAFDSVHPLTTGSNSTRVGVPNAREIFIEFDPQSFKGATPNRMTLTIYRKPGNLDAVTTLNSMPAAPIRVAGDVAYISAQTGYQAIWGWRANVFGFVTEDDVRIPWITDVARTLGMLSGRSCGTLIHGPLPSMSELKWSKYLEGEFFSQGVEEYVLNAEEQFMKLRMPHLEPVNLQSKLESKISTFGSSLARLMSEHATDAELPFLARQKSYENVDLLDLCSDFLSKVRANRIQPGMMLPIPKAVSSQADFASIAVLGVLVKFNKLTRVMRDYVESPDVKRPPDSLMKLYRLLPKLRQWTVQKYQTVVSQSKPKQTNDDDDDDDDDDNDGDDDGKHTADSQDTAGKTNSNNGGGDDDDDDDDDDEAALAQTAADIEARKIEVYGELIEKVQRRCAFLMNIVPPLTPQEAYRVESASTATGSDSKHAEAQADTNTGNTDDAGIEMTEEEQRARATMRAWQSTRDSVALSDAAGEERVTLVWKYVLQFCDDNTLDVDELQEAFRARRDRARSRVAGLHALRQLMMDLSSAALKHSMLSASFVPALSWSVSEAMSGNAPSVMQRLSACGEKLSQNVQQATRELLVLFIDTLQNSTTSSQLCQSLLHTFTICRYAKDLDFMDLGIFTALEKILRLNESNNGGGGERKQKEMKHEAAIAEEEEEEQPFKTSAWAVLDMLTTVLSQMQVHRSNVLLSVGNADAHAAIAASDAEKEPIYTILVGQLTKMASAMFQARKIRLAKRQLGFVPSLPAAASSDANGSGANSASDTANNSGGATDDGKSTGSSGPQSAAMAGALVRKVGTMVAFGMQTMDADIGQTGDLHARADVYADSFNVRVLNILCRAGYSQIVKSGQLVSLVCAVMNGSPRSRIVALQILRQVICSTSADTASSSDVTCSPEQIDAAFKQLIIDSEYDTSLLPESSNDDAPGVFTVRLLLAQVGQQLLSPALVAAVLDIASGSPSLAEDSWHRLRQLGLFELYSSDGIAFYAEVIGMLRFVRKSNIPGWDSAIDTVLRETLIGLPDLCSTLNSSSVPRDEQLLDMASVSKLSVTTGAVCVYGGYSGPLRVGARVFVRSADVFGTVVSYTNPTVSVLREGEGAITEESFEDVVNLGFPTAEHFDASIFASINASEILQVLSSTVMSHSSMVPTASPSSFHGVAAAVLLSRTFRCLHSLMQDRDLAQYCVQDPSMRAVVSQLMEVSMRPSPFPESQRRSTCALEDMSQSLTNQLSRRAQRPAELRVVLRADQPRVKLQRPAAQFNGEYTRLGGQMQPHQSVSGELCYVRLNQMPSAATCNDRVVLLDTYGDLGARVQAAIAAGARGIILGLHSSNVKLEQLHDDTEEDDNDEEKDDNEPNLLREAQRAAYGSMNTAAANNDDDPFNNNQFGAAPTGAARVDSSNAAAAEVYGAAKSGGGTAMPVVKNIDDLKRIVRIPLVAVDSETARTLRIVAGVRDDEDPESLNREMQCAELLKHDFPRHYCMRALEKNNFDHAASLAWLENNKDWIFASTDHKDEVEQVTKKQTSNVAWIIEDSRKLTVTWSKFVSGPGSQAVLGAQCINGGFEPTQLAMDTMWTAGLSGRPSYSLLHEFVQCEMYACVQYARRMCTNTFLRYPLSVPLATVFGDRGQRLRDLFIVALSLDSYAAGEARPREHISLSGFKPLLQAAMQSRQKWLPRYLEQYKDTLAVDTKQVLSEELSSNWLAQALNTASSSILDVHVRRADDDDDEDDVGATTDTDSKTVPAAETTAPATASDASVAAATPASTPDAAGAAAATATTTTTSTEEESSETIDVTDEIKSHTIVVKSTMIGQNGWQELHMPEFGGMSLNLAVDKQFCRNNSTVGIAFSRDSSGSNPIGRVSLGRYVPKDTISFDTNRVYYSAFSPNFYPGNAAINISVVIRNQHDRAAIAEKDMLRGTIPTAVAIAEIVQQVELRVEPTVIAQMMRSLACSDGPDVAHVTCRALISLLDDESAVDQTSVKTLRLWIEMLEHIHARMRTRALLTWHKQATPGAHVQSLVELIIAGRHRLGVTDTIPPSVPKYMARAFSKYRDASTAVRMIDVRKGKLRPFSARLNNGTNSHMKEFFFGNTCVQGGGKWYFEVTLKSVPQSISIGLVRRKFTPGYRSTELGYDRQGRSWSMSGPNTSFYHRGSKCEPTQSARMRAKASSGSGRSKKKGLGSAAWFTGSVIGVLIDLDNREIEYTCNGKSLGSPFQNIDVDAPFYPVVALGRASQVSVNFGRKPFSHFPGPNPQLSVSDTPSQSGTNGDKTGLSSAASTEVGASTATATAATATATGTATGTAATTTAASAVTVIGDGKSARTSRAVVGDAKSARRAPGATASAAGAAGGDEDEDEDEEDETTIEERIVQTWIAKIDASLSGDAANASTDTDDDSKSTSAETETELQPSEDFRYCPFDDPRFTVSSWLQRYEMASNTTKTVYHEQPLSGATIADAFGREAQLTPHPIAMEVHDADCHSPEDRINVPSNVLDSTKSSFRTNSAKNCHIVLNVASGEATDVFLCEVMIRMASGWSGFSGMIFVSTSVPDIESFEWCNGFTKNHYKNFCSRKKKSKQAWRPHEPVAFFDTAGLGTVAKLDMPQRCRYITVKMTAKHHSRTSLSISQIVPLCIHGSHPLARLIGSSKLKQEQKSLLNELTTAARKFNADADTKWDRDWDERLVNMTQSLCSKLGFQITDLDSISLTMDRDDMMRYPTLAQLPLRTLQARFALIKHMNRLVRPLIEYVDIRMVTGQQKLASLSVDPSHDANNEQDAIRQRRSFRHVHVLRANAIAKAKAKAAATGDEATLAVPLIRASSLQQDASKHTDEDEDTDAKIDISTVDWDRQLTTLAHKAASKDIGGQSLSHIVHRLKGMYFLQTKQSVFEALIAGGNSSSSGSGALGFSIRLTLNRMKAIKSRENPAKDPEGLNSVFGQTFVQCQTTPASSFQQIKKSRQFLQVVFLGEGSIDVGGPFRETITMLAADLMSESTPLFIPCPNQRNNVGLNREKYVVNPASTSSLHISMYEFVGVLMGTALRSGETLNLDLPALFWKQMLDEDVELEDVEGVDKLFVQALGGIVTLAQDKFQYVVEEKFATQGSDGAAIELKNNGNKIDVTVSNRDEFAELSIQHRCNETPRAISAIKKGLFGVVPQQFLALLNPYDLELMVCGNPIVDLKQLRSHTQYRNCTGASRIVKHLWKALESFRNHERQMFLRFVWGRSRLPINDSEWAQDFTVHVLSPNDSSLPIAHTCFFSLELPGYSTYEILRSKLLYAIHNCVAVDADFQVQNNVSMAAWV
jgi:HECT-domain (ubiquitin-transferase)/Concanavalin A-like lectin/glucanases superfamily/SPRY domain